MLEDPKEIYLELMRIIRSFVEETAHFTVTELANYNPSVEELAMVINRLATMFKVIALTGEFEDQNISHSAFQCSDEMNRLSEIVKMNRSDEEVKDVMTRLKMHLRSPNA